MKYAIEVCGLSKHFSVIAKRQTLYDLFKIVVSRQTNRREFWALKDINFVLERGDSLGIIGANGSGKTTLLKIMLGLYRQTAGTVRLNGRIAAFFQFGLGMEREMSVLDNIYLFGVIMGLDKREIESRLNNIVGFSGLGDFMHAPLKDLSTGAIGRLATSIAKETDTEIILLDEILTGVDLGFREKSLEAFAACKEASRTLVVTSHDMELIGELCDKVLVLDKGRQICVGSPKEAISIYKNLKS